MYKLNKKYIILSSLIFILFCSFVFVYAGNNDDYNLNSVQIECLFNSEQEILNNYQVPIDSISVELINEETMGLNENSLINIENQIKESVEKIKFIEYNEEFKVNNRLATTTINSEVFESGYIWPVLGYNEISSPYGWRDCPFHGREFHSGIDIPAPNNTPVFAVKSGEIILSEYSNSYGNYIIVCHNDNSRSLYAHLEKRYVKVGEAVNQGHIIGGVGSTGESTGNHLHFEIWKTSSVEDRTNPLDYYK